MDNFYIRRIIVKITIISISLFLFIAAASSIEAQTECSGNIYSDAASAEACVKLAEQQGGERGYDINCAAEKVGHPFVNPSTGLNYYYNPACVVNGSAGHGAALLAGYSGGGTGLGGGTLLSVNSGWDILKTELKSEAAASRCGAGNWGYSPERGYYCVSSGGALPAGTYPPSSGAPTAITPQAVNNIISQINSLISGLNTMSVASASEAIGRIQQSLQAMGITPTGQATGTTTIGNAQTSSTAFPRTVRTNTGALNARIAPNTTAQLAARSYNEQTFIAIGAVCGENVQGEARWWVTHQNTYMWAGGTREESERACFSESSDSFFSASLYANNQEDITVKSGDVVTFKWTSVGAVSATSSYTADAPDNCPGGVNFDGEIKPWAANTLNGSVAAEIQECQIGKTYTITFTVENEEGESISKNITVRVAARIPEVPIAELSSRIGVYHWGPERPDAHGNPVVSGVEFAAQRGFKTIRLPFSANHYTNYGISSACFPNFTLTNLAATEEMRAAFSNPQISTFILTAYDGATFGDCHAKKYMTPSFFNAANTELVEREYKDFVLYLYQLYQDSGKTFIISNWEGDNDVYCGSAYGYAINYGTPTSTRETCNANYPSIYSGNSQPQDSLQAMKLWFEARQRGIQAGKAEALGNGLSGVNVYHAPEFNIVHLLKDGGLKSVLYDVLPNISSDMVSYSSYESVNKPDPASSLSADISLIRSITGREVIVGEFGFDRNEWGEEAAEERLKKTADALINSGASYGIIWQLFDQPGQTFGLFDQKGEARLYKGLTQ